MVELPNNQKGSCMCGAVRFETTGRPSRILNCHCESCRNHTGAPMATLAVYEAEQVRFAGEERKIYQSATGVGRAFCLNCGSTLTWETTLGDEGKLCAIHVSAFENPELMNPTGHSFYSERLPWFDALDNLPRHKGFVAGSDPMQFGPSHLDQK